MFMYTDYTQHLLDNVKKIHFIGCGGSGMYPLIQILAAKGYDISGSDVLDGSIIRSEREMGVKVTLGHSADNVIGADLVVYSAAIAKDNAELNAAASYGITTVERSVLLGYVSRLYKQSICVSGTHGKTTTTSMITTALELAGRDPSAVIGGKLPLIHGYGKAGKGDDIVIEACEFSETFLKLTPYLSVVLNIDNDHLDYYGSMGELKFAFKRFALMTQFMIFANADDKNTMDVMYTLDRRVRTFGINNDGDYQAVNVQEYKPGFFEFDLKEWSKVTGHIRLAVPGRHNIYNALAMCAVCRFAGLTVEQCAAAAASFKGAGRRFEVYGECNGAVVVDDYAHHPTELRATLTTAKELGYKRHVVRHSGSSGHLRRYFRPSGRWRHLGGHDCPEGQPRGHHRHDLHRIPQGFEARPGHCVHGVPDHRLPGYRARPQCGQGVRHRGGHAQPQRRGGPGLRRAVPGGRQYPHDQHFGNQNFLPHRGRPGRFGGEHPAQGIRPSSVLRGIARSLPCPHP